MKNIAIKSAVLLMLITGVFSASDVLALHPANPQKGLQLIEEDANTKYALYVPKNYTSDKEWPLFVLLPWFGDSSEATLNHFADEAEKRGYVVIVPEWHKTVRGVPDASDRWFFKLIKKLQYDFNLSAEPILAGIGDGADYATYLALRYPKKLPTLIALGGSLDPSFETLISYRKLKKNPVRVWNVVGGADPTLAQRHLSIESIRKQNEQLRNAGLYVTYREDLEATDSLSDLVPAIFDWIENDKKETAE